MIKSMQDNGKKIIIYFLCGLLIFSILFMTSGCEEDEKDDLNYSPARVRVYSKKTLTNLYQVFPKGTKESKKYAKAKDNNYKNFISTNALKRSDFQTLIAICKKEPTKMNKAYVFACGWNIEYDKAHMGDYANCLIYYRDRMSKKERKQISTPLHRIMDSCIEDPTGKEQREENDNRNGDDDTTIIPFPVFMYSNSGSTSYGSSSSSGESSEESSSESESGPSESESEPTESAPSEPAE